MHLSDSFIFSPRCFAFLYCNMLNGMRKEPVF
ncbi:hypothetical protein X965_11730 [Morganella sp. EGD-HP17]|nr:hypothetical protein X965_11730 [Morganella sp. EGD-HP17]